MDKKRPFPVKHLQKQGDISLYLFVRNIAVNVAGY